VGAMEHVRARLAALAGAGLGALSRAAGQGQGSVVGGHAILALEPRALSYFSSGRKVALVSGTNGKTTTTKLLASALSAVTGSDVVTNVAGANLPTGLAVALASARPRSPAVLEVDEAWLAKVASDVRPAALVLLNLSRDQLDRNNEVRQVAERWRRTCELAGPGAAVVANADDPLVAWAAMAAPSTLWAGAGLTWKGDATGCPRCGGRVSFEKGTWRCGSCGLARPEPSIWLEAGEGGSWRAAQRAASYELGLQLPGRANAANAVMALAALLALAGESAEVSEQALAAMAAVSEVAGRYATVFWSGTRARLLLAKNPAGWAEVFDMLAPAPTPVVVAINARTADGHDPSWLWDVPFERLRGRRVVATGERRLDLAVRLHYGEVEHVSEPDLLGAITRAGPGGVDVVANYTAFHQILAALRAKRAILPRTPSALAGPAGQCASPGPGTGDLPGPSTGQFGPGTGDLPGPGTGQLPGSGQCELPGAAKATPPGTAKTASPGSGKGAGDATSSQGVTAPGPLADLRADHG